MVALAANTGGAAAVDGATGTRRARGTTTCRTNPTRAPDANATRTGNCGSAGHRVVGCTCTLVMAANGCRTGGTS